MRVLERYDLCLHATYRQHDFDLLYVHTIMK